jgi:tellurite resistance protein
MKSRQLHQAEDSFADLGRRVFAHFYQERFGSGIVLSAEAPRIVVNHHFGNATLLQSGAARIEIALPDVTMNQSTMEEILKVGVEASGIVQRYSAFATENPGESASLSALSILPPALWPNEVREAYQSFRNGPPKVLTFKELPGYLSSGTVIKRLRLNSFVEKLASIGLGIEPDSRLGANIPGPDDPVAIFAANELDKYNSVSGRFNGAEILLQLASIVACSSEGFSDAEASVILNHFESESELPQQEKLRLAARLAIYRKFPPSPAHLKKKINQMAIGIRESIGNFLVHVAGADGTVDPSEVRTLENLFQLLGLETAALYSKIHKAQTQGGTSPSGIKQAGTPVEGIHFDPVRIASLRAESVKISTILDEVFESPVDDIQSVTAPANNEHDTLLGLDLEHAGLLKALLSKTQWSRPEAEQLCAQRGLMVDGAFERINDAAFERFDSPILEGYDPIDINCELVVEEPA